MKRELSWQIFREILKCHISLKFVFRADGRTDGRTWRDYYSPFVILRTRLKIQHAQYKFITGCGLKTRGFVIQFHVGARDSLLESVQINIRPSIQRIPAVLDPDVNGPCVKLTSSLYLMLGQKMSGNVPTPSAFAACARTTTFSAGLK